MQKEVIHALQNNLSHTKKLINALPAAVYTDVTVGPYYSSIGSHVRHCLDFYMCIHNGLKEGKIDLSSRQRDAAVASDPKKASALIDTIEMQLSGYCALPEQTQVTICDDLGLGCIEINQTLTGVLAQACSHSTHHNAIIAYILHALKVELDIPGFGYNPTTPVAKRVGI